ncbi:MAG TPA: hypothetical protein VG206_18235 [Terriglobia bacterium]|nr:hypothetical protein [Terriglobia bacterium]
MNKPLILALSVLSLAPVAPATALPFIRDDCGTALSMAKQRQLPIFVEVWTPW